MRNEGIMERTSRASNTNIYFSQRTEVKIKHWDVQWRWSWNFSQQLFLFHSLSSILKQINCIIFTKHLGQRKNFVPTNVLIKQLCSVWFNLSESNEQSKERANNYYTNAMNESKNRQQFKMKLDGIPYIL
jgi:hypothetical protein